MKTSLWAVIALVTGIVGFLMGYSVSGYTGTRAMAALAGGAHGGEAGAERALANAPSSTGTRAGGAPAPEKPAGAAKAPEEAKAGGAAAGY